MTINQIIHNNASAKVSGTSNIPVNNAKNSPRFSQVLGTSVLNSSVSSPVVSGSSVRNNNLTSGRADLDAFFVEAGRIYNINPNLLIAVAKVESDFRTGVVSNVGAQGIMQIMPATARYLGVTDPFDPRQSIMGGAKYLREQLDRFDQDVSLALAAYNAGWPAVKKHGGIPPFKETQNYVPKVLNHFKNSQVALTETLPNDNVNDNNNVNSNANVNRNANISKNRSSGNSVNTNSMLQQMMFMMMMNMQMGKIGGSSRRGFF